MEKGRRKIAAAAVLLLSYAPHLASSCPLGLRLVPATAVTDPSGPIGDHSVVE